MLNKLLFVLIASAVLNGCCFMQLRTIDQMTELQKAGDFKQLAESEVDCDPGKCGCSKQHFLKGDACLIQAKQIDKTEPKYSTYLQCAEDQLFDVIDNTKDWDEISIRGLSEQEKRAQIYANALEATRLQTTLPNRSQALKRFDQRATSFKQSDPELASANYYFVQNRLYQLDQNEAPCSDWLQLQQQVQTVRSRFASDTQYAAPLSGVYTAVDAYISASCE